MLLIVLSILFNSVVATDYCNLCENGTHTMCRYKEGPADTCTNYTKMWLTPGQKNYIVDIHNDIRNHVASGQEFRGALGTQPAAADMLLLEWDEELAKIAQRWVDQCISVNAFVQHDKCKRTESFEVGQNIVTAIVTDVDLPELSLLILNWYKQISNVIPSDIDDFTGIWRGKHLIGQYTQLVWAKTRFVGCALAAFKESLENTQFNIRFVCNYGPAGNIIGQSVYQRGEPCSRCPQRVCDRVRPNLCTGINKSVFKKQKDITVKKLYDKVTTLSNLIDVEDPKTNKSVFLKSALFNRSQIFPIVLKNMNFFNSENVYEDINSKNIAEIFNANTLDSRNGSNSTIQGETTNSINFSLTLRNKFASVYSANKRFLNKSGNTQNYTKKASTTIKISDKHDITTLVKKTNITNIFTYSTTSTTALTFKELYNKSLLVPNKSLPSNWNNQTFPKNSPSRPTLLSIIKLILEHFFKKSKVHETPEDALIVDLTRNKCEKEVKLHNGIVLVQDCEGDWPLPIYLGKKFLNQAQKRIKTFSIKGNDITFIGDRHFRRVRGIWHNGHCRCTKFLRSCSTTLNVKHYFFILTLFVHFSAI